MTTRKRPGGAALFALLLFALATVLITLVFWMIGAIIGAFLGLFGVAFSPWLAAGGGWLSLFVANYVRRELKRRRSVK